MPERCPHCHIPPVIKGFSPPICAETGDTLAHTGTSEIIRSPNCPIPDQTDEHCYVLPGKTVVPRIEMRVEDGGREVEIRG